MNCAECRDNLVALLEGLLDTEVSRQCHNHLESCASCRAEFEAVNRLQERLAASGRRAAEVSLAGPVMQRVRRAQVKPERISIMSKLYSRWGFGLSAAAGAAAVITVTLMLPYKVRATAVDVMTKGARAVAKLSSIHLQGQLRTLPNDNFGYIDAKREFCNIEIWKQYEPEHKWRVEKPGRVVVMDGQSSVHYLKTANFAVKGPAARSAFDTDWLHRIADLNATITDELKTAQAKGWPLHLKEERAADGTTKAVVTIQANSGLPQADYLKNKFFDNADTRRVFRFDTQTERLEAVQVYLVTGAGETLLFEVSHIDYNQTIDPAVFRLDLPADVHWLQEMQTLPDNEKYAAMTAEQAARAFFEACGRSDWAEVGKFWPLPLDAKFQQYLGGIDIVKLGTPFTSQGYPGQFVPYEIKLNGGHVKKHNLALKRDPKTSRWYVDGGI